VLLAGAMAVPARFHAPLARYTSPSRAPRRRRSTTVASAARARKARCGNWWASFPSRKSMPRFVRRRGHRVLEELPRARGRVDTSGSSDVRTSGRNRSAGCSRTGFH